MNESYEIVEGKDTKQMAVRLLKPRQFKDMIIRFGKVAINETTEGARLAFDFDIIKGKLPSRKAKLSLLEHTLGDILVDILENNLDDVEFAGGDD